jgi:hypothetical protein
VGLVFALLHGLLSFVALSLRESDSYDHGQSQKAYEDRHNLSLHLCSPRFDDSMKVVPGRLEIGES